MNILELFILSITLCWMSSLIAKSVRCLEFRNTHVPTYDYDNILMF